MNDKVFVDINVLLYAHDSEAGYKYKQAKSLLKRLWNERLAALSTQVLQEFTVNLQKKLAVPPSPDEAKRTIKGFLNWNIVVNDGESILEAIDVQERYQLSFRDALIVQAANRSGATLLYSEDLNHGQLNGNVRVQNPFLAKPALQ